MPAPLDALDALRDDDSDEDFCLWDAIHAVCDPSDAEILCKELGVKQHGDRRSDRAALGVAIYEVKVSKEAWAALVLGGAVMLALVWRAKRGQDNKLRSPPPRNTASARSALSVVVLVSGGSIGAGSLGALAGGLAADWIRAARHWRVMESGDVERTLRDLDLGAAEVTSALDEFIVVIDVPGRWTDSVRQLSSSGAVADRLAELQDLVVRRRARLISAKGIERVFVRT